MTTAPPEEILETAPERATGPPVGWSFLRSRRWLGYSAMLLVFAVACVLLAVGALKAVRLAWTVVLSVAFSGALGNLIDRVAYADGFLDGKVVDFLNYGWSVGNVADILLVGAGIAVVVLLVLGVPFNESDCGEEQR